MKTSIVKLLSLAVMTAGFFCISEAQAAAPGGAGGAAPGIGAPAGGRAGGRGGFGGAGGGAAGRGGGNGFGGGGGGRGARGGGAPPGPPAPVPAAVAMVKPTPAEVTQMNAELKRLVETDNSPAKALFQKYDSLVSPALAIPMPRDNPCIRPTQTQQRVGPVHESFVELAKKGNIDLLLEGDSITDWWINQGAVGSRTPTAAYTKYFGNIKTADFAIAGDTTQGVLWGLQNGEGTGFQPKAIMLMIGTNNLNAQTQPAEIAEGIGAIVQENRKDFPNAHILLLAVFPRGLPADANRPKIAEINRIISKLDGYEGHVKYMDIGDKFLDPQTKAFLPDSFRGDNLHPQEKGYDIWGAAVMPTLESWLK